MIDNLFEARVRFIDEKTKVDFSMKWDPGWFGRYADKLKETRGINFVSNMSRDGVYSLLFFKRTDAEKFILLWHLGEYTEKIIEEAIPVCSLPEGHPWFDRMKAVKLIMIEE